MAPPKGTLIRISEYQRRKAGGIREGVGLCAFFSKQGDWAFDYALALARYHNVKLNIFHFLESPYRMRRDIVFVDAQRTKTGYVTPEFLAQKDRELRELYDERSGDYVEVGFRLCEGNHEWELRKCFKKGQYDILVIGYNMKGADFGGSTTVESFAETFKAPVVLVGPDAPDSFYINGRARRRLPDLMIPDGKWYSIEIPG